jgi:uncharacterized protein YndB with AHSA1/START domain
MPVTEVRKDPAALTMTMVADLAAPVERVWQLLADPRQLERWWGPPSYPATVTRHELRPGGRVVYFMKGPEGDVHHGWWRVLSVDPPRGLEVEDGFGDADGNPNPEMPTMKVRFALEAGAAATRFTSVSTFPSLEAMQTLEAMGMEEGARSAMSQIDEILAAPA